METQSIGPQAHMSNTLETFNQLNHQPTCATRIDSVHRTSCRLSSHCTTRQARSADRTRDVQAGFKLFGFELRVASRLVFKQLRGGQGLTRRERKQLTRTTADIFRMVPFSLFIIVPFAELLLPIALRLFPNMLPSTFQSKLKEEEDLKKLLKVKTELARFLQVRR